MICPVMAGAENFQAAIDQVFDISRARPDVVYGVNFLARLQVVMDDAQEAILAAAVNPRRANDKASRAFFADCLLAGDFGFSLAMTRRGLSGAWFGRAAY